MYDFILEVGHAIWKNGLSLSALGTALFVLLRQKKVKRKLKKLIPMLFDEDSEVKEYVSNQVRIESKIDAIARHMGVTNWNAEEHALTANTGKNLWRSSQVVISPADSVGVSIRRMNNLLNWRMKRMAKKLWSRKFLLALATGILVVLNDGLDLGLDKDTIMMVVTVVVGWIFGESGVDIARTRKEASLNGLDSVAKDSGEV